ncbi:hypothetical protein BC834DRAFT_995241 [Gloeopeniophorella convolvens]|nr:hypothetical protein BC834DRAFT_995241 [Gloeopeniophorella convolvens]
MWAYGLREWACSNLIIRPIGGFSGGLSWHGRARARSVRQTVLTVPSRDLAVLMMVDAFVSGMMRHVPHEVERYLPHLLHPHARAHRSRSPHPHPHPWEEGVVVHAPAPAAGDDEAWVSEPEEDPPTPAEPDAPSTEPPLPTDSLSQLPAGSSSERRRPRPRHRRLASLKGSARGSREASPAHSVRWADEAPRSAGMSPAGAARRRLRLSGRRATARAGAWARRTGARSRSILRGARDRRPAARVTGVIYGLLDLSCVITNPPPGFYRIVRYQNRLQPPEIR